MLLHAARRICTTAAREVLKDIKQQYGQNLYLHEATRIDETTRPIVLMIGWLLAKQHNMSKFAKWYVDRGVHTISILPRTSHCLNMKQAEAMAESMLHLVTTAPFRGHPLLIHGFSVGGFLYGRFLMELINHPDRDAVAASTRGQILDSVVDVEGIPFGVSAALFKNPFARRFTQNCLEKLLSMNEKRMEIYLASSRIFKENPLRTPTHVMYSHVDPITDSDRIENVMDKWKESGIPTTCSVFDESSHVQHMKQYYDKYYADLEKFVRDHVSVL
eukprot:gene7514-9808_t